MRWEIKFWIKAAIIIVIVLAAIIWSATALAVMLADKIS